MLNIALGCNYTTPKLQALDIINKLLPTNSCLLKCHVPYVVYLVVSIQHQIRIF